MDGSVDVRTSLVGTRWAQLSGVPVLRHIAFANQEWEQHPDLPFLVQAGMRIGTFLKECGVKQVFPFVIDTPNSPPVLAFRTSNIGARRMHEIFTDACEQLLPSDPKRDKKKALTLVGARTDIELNMQGGMIGRAVILPCKPMSTLEFAQRIDEVTIAPSAKPRPSTPTFM